MKKKIGIVATCALVFLIAGCGKTNKLVCTYNEKFGGAKISVEIEFDGDKVKAANNIMEFADKETAKSMYNLSKQDEDNDIEVKLSGKKMIVSLAEQELKQMEEYKNKEELKKYYEELNYTCK